MVGLPVRTVDGRPYNVAAVVAGGRVHGFVPKQHLPNRAEFYEDRWFTRALGRVPTTARSTRMSPSAQTCCSTLGTGDGRFVLAIEICEDLWAVEPPSGRLALAGADVIANPIGSPELLGKSAYRGRARTPAVGPVPGGVPATPAPAPGESTMDVVFGGQSLIVENGDRARRDRALRVRFTRRRSADIDVVRLAARTAERTPASRTTAARPTSSRCRRRTADSSPATSRDDLRRPVDPHSLRAGRSTRSAATHCEEIFAIQSTGLAKRLVHTGARNVTIGISGGLDSTLALLVTVQRVRPLGLPRSADRRRHHAGLRHHRAHVLATTPSA